MKIGPFELVPEKGHILGVIFRGRRVFGLLAPKGASEQTAMRLAKQRFRDDMAGNIALAEIHWQNLENEKAERRY